MSPAAILDAGEAEQASLAAADQLFYARGVNAVTMGDIRDLSRVPLRRLYTMYPSKSELVSAWLRHRHGQWMKDFAGRVGRQMREGDEPVDAVFSALSDWMAETDFRGCGFINTHAESSSLTDDQRTIIRSHKADLASYLSTLELEGDALAVIVDGAIVQASIFLSTDPIRHAHRAASALTAESSA